jgi:hypothetical protein
LLFNFLLMLHAKEKRECASRRLLYAALGEM